jgi:hypothetical protein
MSKTTSSSPSLMLNAVIVLRPLPTFPVLVRRPILHAVVVRCRRPPPSSTTIAVVTRRRCLLLPPSLPQPSSPLCCLCHLLPPALVLPSHSRPPDLASLIIRRRHCPPPLSSGVAVIVHHRHLPPSQPSSPLSCLRHLSSPLSLPHCSLPPKLACLRCPPSTITAAVITSAAPFS